MMQPTAASLQLHNNTASCQNVTVKAGDGCCHQYSRASMHGQFQRCHLIQDACQRQPPAIRTALLSRDPHTKRLYGTKACPERDTSGSRDRR